MTNEIIECYSCGDNCAKRHFLIIQYSSGIADYDINLCSRKCIREYYKEYGKDEVEEKPKVKTYKHEDVENAIISFIEYYDIIDNNRMLKKLVDNFLLGWLM